MSKKTIGALLTSLCALICLTLFACSDEKLEIAFSGVYSIVRSDYSEKAPMDAYRMINERLSELGAQLELKTDFLNTRAGETPSEYELLLGSTEREESIRAMSEYKLGTTEYLIKSEGTKIILLAGGDRAYTAAIDLLCECYEPESGLLILPEAVILGKWNPPLEGLKIGGVPIGEFEIVSDGVMGLGSDELAAELQSLILELVGVELPLKSDEDAISAHELIIGSHKTLGREIPENQNGASLADGKLLLIADTAPELTHTVERFTEGFLRADSQITDITNEILKETIVMNKYAEQILKVEGKTPAERGEALKSAVEKANRLLKASADEPISLTIELSDGEYIIDETLVIEDTAFSKLHFRAAEGAKPMISGALSIPDSAWKKVDGKPYYSVKLESDEKIRYIFSNGYRIPLAKSEVGRVKFVLGNYEDRKDPENLKGFYLQREIVEKLENPDYPTELAINAQWHFYRLHVTGVDYNDTRLIDTAEWKPANSESGDECVRVKLDESELARMMGHYQSSLAFGKVRFPYYIENNLSFIEPGSCVCDYGSNTVYYYPESGAPKSVSYSTLEVLMSFKNAANIGFEGIGFTGTACRMNAEEGYYSNQANGVSKYGILDCAAVSFDSCTNVSFDKCSFTGLGGNGILSLNTLNGMTIENCRFDDLSMSAIWLGNRTWEDATIWKSNDAQYNISIVNNDIKNVGVEISSASAIFVTHADGIKVNHNTIHNVPYCGIMLGWGWDPASFGYGERVNIRNGEIAYNHITEFMTCTDDGGAIYVTNGNCKPEYTELFNEIHDNFVMNDQRRQRGYYLDGSSSNWHVYDNVVIGTELPLFVQYQVKTQFTNNVLSERIYSTDAIAEGNHKPERNVILGDIFIEPTREELYKKYPAAEAIEKAAGMEDIR